VAAFPAMTATDNATPSAAIAIACVAPLGAGGASVNATGGSDGTAFPVGTTIVACTAADATGHVSLPEIFVVVVACPVKFFFIGGVCKGG
jgi:hypothetical protein